jgi:uncharacterized protein (TIGR03000 family)
MRKMILCAALACVAGLLAVDTAKACHRGWGGAWGCRGYYGSYWYGGGNCGPYYGSYYYRPAYYGPVYYSATPAPATLVVNLPADAVLTIDGNPTKATSAKRIFETPALETGRDFAYTLEAKVVRNGQEYLIKQRVTVRAGQQTQVLLDLPAIATTD